MKHPKLKTTARYWRVRAEPTMEEQIFSTYPEALAWTNLVQHTLQSENMVFVFTQVTERTYYTGSLGFLPA